MSKLFLLRKIASFSLYSALPPSKLFSNPQTSFSRRLPLSLSLSSLRTFSSGTHSSPPHAPSPAVDVTPSNDDLPADITTQELKQRIDNYLGGDAEALPTIFEAILARKLSGNHNETDDELMEELRSKSPHNDDDNVLSDSDEDEVSDSDEDLFDSDEELSD